LIHLRKLVQQPTLLKLRPLDNSATARFGVDIGLSAIGLTVADAFRLMMVRIAKERALPFQPLIDSQ